MLKTFMAKSICTFAFLLILWMINNSEQFYNTLLEKFPFTPTTVQDSLLEMLSTFFFDTDNRKLFLLKGFAGTGKTTTMSTVVNNLWRVGMKSVLLAPTGRAAKVIANYANRQSFTIHKKIYHPRKAKNGSVSFVLQTNRIANISSAFFMRCQLFL